jgi:hypothetical protein
MILVQWVLIIIYVLWDVLTYLPPNNDDTP